MRRKELTYRNFCAYWASIIIGSGILTLPLKGSKLGFIPLWALVIGIGIFFYSIYKDLTEQIYSYIDQERKKEVKKIKPAYEKLVSSFSKTWLQKQKESLFRTYTSKGQRLFDSVAEYSNIGIWGKRALFFGMFFYVFFADIGYILIGFSSLKDISIVIEESGRGYMFCSFLAIIGIILILYTIYMEKYVVRARTHLHATLKRLTMIIGVWFISIFAIINMKTIFPESTSFVLIGTILYSFSVLSIMMISDPPFSEEKEGDLFSRHKVNVFLMYLELALLFVTILVVAYYFTKLDLLEKPLWIDFPEGGTVDFVRTLLEISGLIIFAYVGTGVYNLTSYPRLFRRQRSGKTHFSRIAFLGTILVLLLYLLWSSLSALTLSDEMINQLNLNHEYSTIGMARILRAHVSWVAWIVMIFGYLFALLAVTSACHGFTDTLSERIDIVRGNRLKFVDRRLIHVFIIFAAMISALLIELYGQEIELTKILDVAGNAGGGLLLLILPWFYLARESRIKWRVAVGTLGILYIFISNVLLIEGWSTIAQSIISSIILLVSAISLIIGIKVICEEGEIS